MTKFKLVFLFVFVFLFFLRIYRLDQLTLFGDEIDVGYQSYSLLTSAHDYKGNFLPLYIQSLTESRAPLLMYVTIPFVALFGLNQWGIRLPEVAFSLLSLYFFFLLLRLFSKDKYFSLLSTFLLGLSYWHLIMED
ncbi:hypothetical protein M1116_00785 [Patescibacteria group bacterium]|nr:hypothetical protein [Patescibacteria group bacterium]